MQLNYDYNNILFIVGVDSRENYNLLLEHLFCYSKEKNVVIGISDIFSKISYLKEMVEQAVYRSKLSFYISESTVFSSGTDNNFKDIESTFIDDHLREC